MEVVVSVPICTGEDHVTKIVDSRSLEPVLQIMRSPPQLVQNMGQWTRISERSQRRTRKQGEARDALHNGRKS